MVFWADVAIEPADFAVLSLLGPGGDAPAVLEALGLAAPLGATAVPVGDAGVSSGERPAATRWNCWCRAPRRASGSAG